jgi:hypothetical protein
VVLDPMCGIGTTLVEAVHAGRDALGIEYEPRWADLAAAGLAHATTHGATGAGHVLHGDARTITPSLTGQYPGRVGLLLTSPPYGVSVHGQVRATGTSPVAKWDHAYGADRANLARATTPRLLAGFTQILRNSHALLRPGAVVVVTARPWRRNGLLLDFPSAVLSAATDAGYQPVQRCVALLAAIRDGRLVTRASFFQINATRRLREAGLPVHVIAHEDVLILRKLVSPAPGRSQDAATPPDRSAQPPGKEPDMPQRWTAEQIRALGAVTDLVTAGQILGIGRTTSHTLARHGTFPVPVLRIGHRYLIPVAPLLRLLHLEAGPDPRPAEDPGFRPGNGTAPQE